VAALLGCLLGTVTVLVPSFALASLVFPRLFTHRIGSAKLRSLRAWQLIGCMSLGFLLPLAGVALWLNSIGAIPVFWRDFLRPLLRVWFSQPILGMLGLAFRLATQAVLNQSALITAGILTTFTLGTQHEYERPARRQVLILAVLLIAGLTLQSADSLGTLSAVLPLTTLLAGIGIYKTWRRILPLGTAGAIAFWTTSVLLYQMRAPLHYPPGEFIKRSKTRLMYLTRQAPFRSQEMLESELYSSSEYNLPSSRRVATVLKMRSLTNRSIWVAGNEPQLAWMLDGIPAYRFVEPVPALWTAATPQLTQRAVDEAGSLQTDTIVIAGPATASDAVIRSGARSSEDYTVTEVIDGSWRVYQRVKKPPAKDEEFCEP
jgi:hypothetical protein